MWRRETRLGYWLSRDSQPEKLGLVAGFKEKILQKLYSVDFSNPIHAETLPMESAVRNLAEDSIELVIVHDGLSQIRLMPDPSPWNDIIFTKNDDKMSVNSINLMDSKITVKNVRVPSQDMPRVHSGILQITPKLHNLLLWKKDSAVRNIKSLASELSPVNNGKGWIFKNVAVKNSRSTLSELPFLRRSVNVEALHASEYRGFLKEAETMRRIPVEQCELLAVFRSVPIEMITKLQYLSDKNMILYRICDEPARTQTRLHDIAAIRNRADQEIHLVPHRAQYRMVSLKA
jgi:hypothetical protein